MRVFENIAHVFFAYIPVALYNICVAKCKGPQTPHPYTATSLNISTNVVHTLDVRMGMR